MYIYTCTHIYVYFSSCVFDILNICLSDLHIVICTHVHTHAHTSARTQSPTHTPAHTQYVNMNSHKCANAQARESLELQERVERLLKHTDKAVAKNEEETRVKHAEALLTEEVAAAKAKTEALARAKAAKVVCVCVCVSVCVCVFECPLVCIYIYRCIYV